MWPCAVLPYSVPIIAQAEPPCTSAKRGGMPAGLGIKPFTDDSEHVVMNPPVAGHEFGLIDGMRIAAKIGNASAGFTKDEDSGRHVPRTQCELPESVEPSGRDIAQIQRGASRTPHALRFEGKAREVIEVVVRILTDIVRKTGHEKGGIERSCVRHRERLAVQEGAAAGFGREQFVPGRVIDDTDQQLISIFQADGNGVHRKPVGKIRGAVKRIDDPTKRRGAVRVAAALLCEDTMVRIMLPDVINDTLFGGMVRIGHEIDRIFAFDVESRPGAVQQDQSCGFCSVPRNGE